MSMLDIFTSSFLNQTSKPAWQIEERFIRIHESDFGSFLMNIAHFENDNAN